MHPAFQADPIPVRVKAVSPLVGNSIPFPQAMTAGAAGIDLAACLEEPVTLAPGEIRLIPTGIAVQLPGPHVGAFIFARSGLASKFGIHMANGVGVVDSDYRGEVMCPLQNGGRAPFVVRPGDRIAQMVFLPVYAVRLIRSEELDETERGAGGFGHTGR